MTYEQALEFFARYGNTTKDADRLRDVEPTGIELHASINAAILKGQDKGTAFAARQAVLDYFKEKNPCPISTENSGPDS